jgi:hypothetical protein
MLIFAIYRTDCSPRLRVLGLVGFTEYDVMATVISCDHVRFE